MTSEACSFHSEEYMSENIVESTPPVQPRRTMARTFQAYINVFYRPVRT